MAITINGNGTITGLSTGGLPDGCVDSDTLAANAVTSGKLASGAVTQGITMVDHWRMSADTAAGTTASLTDWTQVSTSNHQPGRIGSSMTVSGGVFSFPETGIYNITGSFAFYIGSNNDNIAQVWLKVSYDGTNYNTVTSWRCGETNDGIHNTITQNYVLDVTSTSDVKFYFQTDSFSAQSDLRGDANNGESNVTIMRLGDT